MKNLKSMTDFVLEQAGWHGSTIRNSDYEFQQKVIKYANFLKQPLKLEMFVPYDDEGNVLEDPCQHNKYCTDVCQGRCAEEYYEALEKVLFDLGKVDVVQNHNGYFEIEVSFPDENYSERVSISKDDTIEDLLTLMVDFDWELTENALKQIGL